MPIKQSKTQHSDAWRAKTMNNTTVKPTINWVDSRENQIKQQTIPTVLTTPVTRRKEVARKNA